MSLENIVLACHEFRCSWSEDEPVYETHDRYGRRIWERKLPCTRGCGSVRVDRSEPNLQAMLNPRREYLRSPAWHAYPGIFFSAARIARIRAQGKITKRESVSSG